MRDHALHKKKLIILSPADETFAPPPRNSLATALGLIWLMFTQISLCILVTLLAVPLLLTFNKIGLLGQIDNTKLAKKMTSFSIVLSIQIIICYGFMAYYYLDSVNIQEQASFLLASQQLYQENILSYMMIFLI